MALTLGNRVAEVTRPTQSRGLGQTDMPATPKSTVPIRHSTSLRMLIRHHHGHSEDLASTLDTELTVPSPMVCLHQHTGFPYM